MLNHYLTEMSQIALSYGATIDKYVGDAIVIFFGDPETRGVKEDALACVEMAIAMRKRMRELQDVWRASGTRKAPPVPDRDQHGVLHRRRSVGQSRQPIIIAIRHHADRVPAGTHRGDGDHTRSRASLTMEDISHASWDDAEEKDKP